MLSSPNEPIQTAILQDNKKRITTTYPDGKEVIEEVDVNTKDIIGIVNIYKSLTSLKHSIE